MCKETCVICQEDIIDDKSIMPCNHQFHPECMAVYIENKIKTKADIECPICRCNHFKLHSREYEFLRGEIDNINEGQRYEEEQNRQKALHEQFMAQIEHERQVQCEAKARKQKRRQKMLARVLCFCQ